MAKKPKIPRVQIADILVGVVVGIILTLLFTNFITPLNLKSKEKAAVDTAQDNSVKTGTANISDDPYLGNRSKAKVAIVEFTDLECPYCQKFEQETFDQIVKDYVDTNKIIFSLRDFPLEFHKPAVINDITAAECVYAQDRDSNKYFNMVKLIFANTGLNGKGIDDSKIVELAGEAGADKNKFKSCYDSKPFTDEIQKDTADGTAAGTEGTPSFVIGKLKSDGTVTGETLVGAQPIDAFKQAIEKYLK